MARDEKKPIGKPIGKMDSPGKTKSDLIKQLRQIAKEWESRGNHAQRDAIQEIIDAVNAGKQDHAKVKIQAKVTIAKYDGDKKPDSTPVEVDERVTEL